MGDAILSFSIHHHQPPEVYLSLGYTAQQYHGEALYSSIHISTSIQKRTYYFMVSLSKAASINGVSLHSFIHISSIEIACLISTEVADCTIENKSDVSMDCANNYQEAEDDYIFFHEKSFIF